MTRGGLEWRAIVLAIVVAASACATTPEVFERGGARASGAELESATPHVEAAPTEPAPTALPAPEPTPTAQPSPTPVASPTSVPTATPTAVPLSRVIGDAASRSSLERTPCPDGIDNDAISCHTALVPVHHSDPQSPLLSLLVAVIDNGATERPPVMYFQGGPGVATVVGAERFIGLGHDVILFDQRGTGGSTPKLACPEVDQLWVADRTGDGLDDEVFFDAYQVCADRLRDEGIALEAFNTAAVAADADIVRRLLGYERWSIWGVSYGTRVAQTLMRDHSDGLDAAVLDSVVPFDVDFFASIPSNADRAMNALDAACDADEACFANHGDFATALADAVERYGSEPANVDVSRPVSGESLSYGVDGAEVLDLVFTQLYSTRLLRSLPRQISRSDYGGLDELVSGYVARRDPERFDLSIGVYYTTWCSEEYPMHDPSADDEILNEANLRYGPDFARALAADSIDRLCASFDVPPSDPRVLEPVTSSLPTLVFAGAFDPITPPAWSRSVADRLPTATFIEMPDHGHGMVAPCPIGIREAFLADPTSELDLTCVEETGPPDFD